jgi:hypothetical protein
MLKVIYLVFSLLNVFNGAWMLLFPQSWYTDLPADVPHTGPFNAHFVRDLGVASLVLSGPHWSDDFGYRPRAHPYRRHPDRTFAYDALAHRHSWRVSPRAYHACAFRATSSARACTLIVEPCFLISHDTYDVKNEIVTGKSANGLD